MRFWDSSAIVPLIVKQPASEEAREMLRRDPDCVVWWGTAVECVSAVARLERQAIIRPDSAHLALEALDVLRAGWTIVLASEPVRVQATRVLRTHPLRAADSLQLAAALVWAGAGADREAVCFDELLRAALHAEGFGVVPSAL
jgi:predicted nucleic acid-binding protein